MRASNKPEGLQAAHVAHCAQCGRRQLIYTPRRGQAVRVLGEQGWGQVRGSWYCQWCLAEARRVAASGR